MTNQRFARKRCAGYRIWSGVSLLVCVYLLLVGPVRSAADDFGKSGRSIKSVVEESYGPDNPKLRIVVGSVYDRSGSVVESKTLVLNLIAPDRSSERHVEIKRDQVGKVTEESIYDGSRLLIGKQMYRYGQSGELLEKVTVESDGTVSTKWLYTYDDRGNEKEMKYFMKNVLKARYAYEHDDRGNKIKSSAFKADGSIEDSAVAKFDDKNRMVENVVYMPDGVVKSRATNKFDDRGRLIDRTTYNAQGVIIDKENYSYEVDLKGNWIKRVTTKRSIVSGKNEPAEITERTINYFID